MTEIRYWEQATSLANDTNTKKEQTAKVKQMNESFYQQMATMLMGSDADPYSDLFGSDMPEDLLSGMGLDESSLTKLNNAKNQGMEKVWAARMQNTLPFSDWDSGYNNKKNQNNDLMGGFGNIIELTVKMQLAQARKQLQQTGNSASLSLQEFIASDKLNTPVTASSEETRLSSEIEKFREQIAELAKKFNSSTEEIVQRLVEKA